MEDIPTAAFAPTDDTDSCIPTHSIGGTDNRPMLYTAIPRQDSCPFVPIRGQITSLTIPIPELRRKQDHE